MRITPITLPFAPSAQLAKQHTKLTQAVDKFNQQWVHYDAEATAVREATEWTAPLEARAEDLRANRIGLLNNELLLRSQLDTFCTDAIEAQGAALTKAYGALEALKADIHQRLLSIGFHDGLLGETYCIKPEMILRHPEVYQARNAYNNLQASESIPTYQRLNAEALKRCREEIEELKRSVVSGIRT